MNIYDAYQTLDYLKQSFCQMMHFNKSLDFLREIEAINIVMDTSKAPDRDKWIKVTSHKPDDEEREEWGEECECVYDCYLPEDGQQVIITDSNGNTNATVFYKDDKYGCYFEYYEGAGDVTAWMPMPEPFKEGRNDHN